MSNPEPASVAVIPLEGTTEQVPHISIEVLLEGSKQIDDQLIKNTSLKNQLQQTLTNVQNELGRVNMNEAALKAQKAITDEYRKTILGLIAPPVNA